MTAFKLGLSLEQSLASAKDTGAEPRSESCCDKPPEGSRLRRRREEALDALPMQLVLSFASISAWAHMCAASPAWRSRLASGSDVFAQMALSLQLPDPCGPRVLRQLIAAERLASPQYTPTAPSTLLSTPTGGGIWCLELHRASNLVFAGCWGPMHQVDLVKCWDAATGKFVSSLYGHFSDVKCLVECGQYIYSGSYDGMVCTCVCVLTHQSTNFGCCFPSFDSIHSLRHITVACHSTK